MSIDFKVYKKEFVNALSIGIILFLIPIDPFSGNLYLTLATYVLGIIAVLNHLFPYKLQYFTHLVKSAYTQLLYVSIDIVELYPLAFMISVLDLIPLVRSDHKYINYIEKFCVFGRWIAIIIGFLSAKFQIPLLIIYALCSFLYYKERKKKNSREQKA